MGVGCTANIYAATENKGREKPRGQKASDPKSLRPKSPRNERRRDTAIHRMTGDTPPEKDGPSGAKRSTEGCSK